MFIVAGGGRDGQVQTKTTTLRPFDFVCDDNLI